ncbi:hypothetical protein ACMFMF_006537 [Clarireedia jacksonii]
MKFQDTILSGLGRRYYTSANKVLTGSEADRKLDIFLTPADAVLLHGEHDWSNILVIGEHKQNPDEDGSTKTLIQLAGYTREVFGSQPERRFVPGFTMCGSMMRLWVFDRSGLYNSEKFDVHKEPERFVRVIAGPRKLSSKASWVDGSPESSRRYSKSSPRGRSRSSSNRLKGLGIVASTSSSGKKRKRNEILDPGSRLKRSKSDGSHASGTNMRIQEREPDAIGAHSIQETVVDSLAHCRNEWQRNNVNCIQEDGVDSFTDFESEMYDNRVNYCLVTSPAGRPLREYRSVRELLEVLRDAIRGHKSLLEDGKILHRDISENNIIITELPAEGDPKGRLIDLDLAKELDSMPSGARHRTGTMQFMAIEVLEGNGHTYRHDLESFFYVFLWICVRYGYEGTGRPKLNKLIRLRTNLLRGWYTGTYADIARNKVGDMDKNRFEKIIVEFAPKFENLKPLARELRHILFPIRDGAIFTGTFHDHSIMYDGMIKAFDSAIDCRGKEEQVNA